MNFYLQVKKLVLKYESRDIREVDFGDFSRELILLLVEYLKEKVTP